MLGELTDAEMDELLRSEFTARLGCHADGRTYVVPITYVYDGSAVIGHSRDGLKVEMMRRNPAVCVEVDRMDDLANWRSVIGWGRYEELSGEAAMVALERLVQRFEPYLRSETSIPTRGHLGAEGPVPTAYRVVVYRIPLTEKTGRFERR